MTDEQREQIRERIQSITETMRVLSQGPAAEYSDQEFDRLIAQRQQLRDQLAVDMLHTWGRDYASPKSA